MAAPAGDAGPATFNCTTCGTPKLFNHPSWRTKKGAETFCTGCRKVTFYSNPLVDPLAAGPLPGVLPSQPPPAGGASPSPAPSLAGAAAAPAAPPGSPAVSAAPTGGSGTAPAAAAAVPPAPAAPAAAAAPAPAPATTPVAGSDPVPPADLWGELCKRLETKGMTPEDLRGADAETLRGAIGSLGFDPLSAAKLQTELQERHGVPGQPPPAAAGGGKVDAGVSAAVLEMREAETEPAPPPQTRDGETSVEGLGEDSVLRRTQKMMESEIDSMTKELSLLKQQLAQAESAAKTAKSEPPASPREETPAPEPVGPSVPYPELSTARVPAELWPVLVERLGACGLSEGALAACSPTAFDAVLRQLAFTPVERARLAQEFQARHGVGAKEGAPSKPAPDPPKPVRPAVALEDPPDGVGHEATPLNFLGPPTGASLPAAEGAAAVGTNLTGEPDLVDPSGLHRWPHWQGPGWPSAASANPPSESALGEHGWMPLPRCPVHPDKEVEFWDPITETLVSAHAHLSGTHKDHPFVPMGEAAKRELPGLADWQVRAAGLNAKLLDHRAALDEVHQTIDSVHQQQLDAVVLTIEQIKQQLDDHRDQLVARVRGHAAAQHELFRPTEERLRVVRGVVSEQLGLLDTHLGADPEQMSSEDVKRWAVGVMVVRERLGSIFAANNLHPITVPNWTQLRFNADLTDDIVAKLFLTKNPATVPLPSLIDLRDASHPMFATRDRISFHFAEPEPPADGTDTQSPIQLRNDQLTARYAGGGSGHVLLRGTASFVAGRHYWEFRIDSAHNDNRLGTHIIVGLVAEGANSMGAATGLAWCVDKVSGMVPMAVDSPPWTPGVLLGIFLDLELDRVGLYHNKQCIAHLAIPHGCYTPAASIQCGDDQITLVPLADIPHGVSFTSGMMMHKDVYGSKAQRHAAGGAARSSSAVGVPTPEEDAAQRHIEQLQGECVRLQAQIKDTKRELAEQQRSHSQQKFQSQQISDLRRRIDEATEQMAKQQVEFEAQSADDLRRLQEHKQKQLEEEMKRTWQLQAETVQRTKEVRASAQQQQDQQERLERFLREQQVLLTEHMLQRQKQQQMPPPPPSRTAGASPALLPRGAGAAAAPPHIAVPYATPLQGLGTPAGSAQVSPQRAARWAAADGALPPRLVSPNLAPGRLL
eukprot:TRINITY_DN1451_c0_g1_i1.p1 TRINITY_DN1451_c0_g1~~TRINITY_DN1451_c0_g1_i1.p1  ORF type:complete len:1197 (+),score=345.69 TRINITY_DN1451_c0_g1_i1:113-3592(+)